MSKLEDTIRVAHSIHTHLHDLSALHEGKVHFRPAANGVTMVGLLPDRPQRGKSGYDAARLRAQFDAEFEQHCVNITQGRATPEKQLQSFLISNAYQHGRAMQALQVHIPPDEDTQLIFVTDEISVLHDERKVVCDILALNRTQRGDIPIVMELKSERAMTRLIQQVEDYAEIITIYQTQFEALFSALLGETIRFAAAPQQWIVWTSPNIDVPDPRETELLQKNIRTVGYVLQEDGFRFNVGAPPMD